MASPRDPRRITSTLLTDPFFAEDEPDEGSGAYLDEGELLLDDGEDDGGFEDEATAVFNPEQHGAYAASAAPDPWAEEELDELVEEFADEATRVWDEGSSPAWQPPASLSPAPYTGTLRMGASPAPAELRAALPVAPPPTRRTARETAPVAPPPTRRTSDLPAVGATQSIPRASAPIARQQLSASRPIHASGPTRALPRQQVSPARESVTSDPVIAVPPVVPRSGLTPVQIGMSAIFGLLVVLLVALYFRPVDRTPDVPSVSTLALFTTPSGAQVSVDGIPRTETTPTTIPDLEVGRTYLVRVSLAGYEGIERPFFIEEPGILQEQLTLSQLTGSVAVITVPDGAQVAINGEQRGTSPLTIEGLDLSRAYVITATLDGYQPGTQQLRWSDDAPRDQAIALPLVATAPAVPVAAAPAPIDEPSEPVAEAPEAPAEPVAVASAPPRTEAAEAPARPTTAPRPTAAAPAPRTEARDDTRPRPTSAPRPTTTAAPEPVRPSERAQTPQRPSERPSAAATPERPVRPSERAQAAPERPSQRVAVAEDPRPDRPSRAERPARDGSRGASNADGGSLSVQAVPYGQVWINGRMVASETPLINHRLPAGAHRVKVYFVPLRAFSDERTIRIEPGASESVTFRAPR